MHLKALDVNGFKSFALPTHLEFSTGLTAIVGPNGSGKSNVADAVRWVLGETSLKTLRGKKSEDVIFAGSHARSRHSMAEVTLVLDNADEGLPVDAAEVSITRRLFRNGDSEYEINGTQVLLRDLHELLLKAGFSQRSYAVVGQGQVDAVLRASPAERKEVFEEAAGVKEYQVRKEQSLRKLEATRRNLVRVEDLVGEIKPRLTSLRRQAERAELREHVEHELHAESLRWFGAELAALDTAAESDIEQLKVVTKERTALDKQIAALEKARSSKEQGALDEEQTAVAGRLERARLELTNFEERRNELRRRRAALEEKELPASVADLPERIATQQAALDRVVRRTRELVPKVETLRAQVAAAEKQRDVTSKKVQELRTALNPTEKAKPAKLDEREVSQLVAELERSLDELVAAIEAATTPDSLTPIKQQARRTRGQLEVLVAKVKRAEPGDQAAVAKELDRVLEVRDAALAELAAATSQLAGREAEHAVLTEQVTDLKQTVTTLERQVAGAKKGGAEGAQRAEITSLQAELKDMDRKLATQEEQVRALEREVADVDEKRRSLRKTGTETEEKLAELREQLSVLVERSGKLQVAEGQHVVRRDDLLREATEQLGESKAKTLARGGATALTDAQRAKLKSQVDGLRRQLEQAGGVDSTVLEEFKSTNERYEFLSKQSADLEEASSKLRELITELDGKIHQLFSRQLDQINVEFDKAFKVLFNGGAAKLTAVRAAKKKIGANDTSDEVTDDAKAAEPADEENDAVTREVERLRAGDGIVGVDVRATPPGKKLQSVSMLSGGEKALTSIALLSAILATKPSPFVILDEVDAALDEANSRRFAKIVRHLSDKTQFITITHNRETMRQASILYGVTMQKDGVSKLLSVKLEDLSGATPAPAAANR